MRPGALSALLLELAKAPKSARDEAWSSPLRAGTKIGRFELVREIGRGGFGVVWEARDPELGRGVAIKCVRLGAEGSPRDARLIEEAEAAGRLSHPNLVTLYDVGRAEQGPYLVFERLRGRTLAGRIRDGPIPLAEALRIATDVARGVAHAHANGIVHRDLKPENVFLCEQGTAKVLDFGLAHAFGRPRQDGGTRGYMAPEQLAGAPEDERTDVFALGVILHEMLVGERPFEDERALGSGREAAPLDVPGCPELAALVGRMLRKSAVARPRDAGEVLDALVAVRPIAGAPPRPPIARRSLRWRGAAVGAAAAMALAAAAVAGHAWRSGRQRAGTGRASVAVLPFADMSPQKDQEYLADGVSEEIRSALSRVDGLRVVGRTSSVYFKGREEALPVIGARLDAKVLVEGSVRRAGDRIRVTARLVNASDGFELWSETYDRALGDVFAVQDDVARRVAVALRAGLLPAAAGADSGTAARVEAYAELLRSRALLDRGTDQDARLAVAALENAIALEPAYAAAHAALCLAYLSLQNAVELETLVAPEAADRILERGLAAADRAVALDPRQPDGYECRGVIRLTAFQWSAARSDLETAIRLSPRPAPRGSYAWVLAANGRIEEAIATAEAVLHDDPLDVGRAAQLATFLNATGRSARARQVLVAALNVDPRNARALRELGFAELLLGHPDEALALARANPSAFMRAVVEAVAFHELGRTSDSDGALATLKSFPSAAYQLAQVRAWRGETDAAFQALDRARAIHDQGLRYLKYDPFLRTLRADPRYAALLRAMNLPVD